MRIDYMHTDKRARRHKQRTRHGTGHSCAVFNGLAEISIFFLLPLITTVHICEFRERHTCVHANWFVVCFSLQSAVRRIRMDGAQQKGEREKKHPVKYISILSECLYFQMGFIAIDRSGKKIQPFIHMLVIWCGLQRKNTHIACLDSVGLHYNSILRNWTFKT